MSRDVSPVPFPATMAFVHIVMKACISCLSLYVIMKPAYMSRARDAAPHEDAVRPSVQLHALLQGDQTGGWDTAEGGIDAGEGGGGGGGEACVEEKSARHSFVVWAARHFGLSREMFMRMGVPAGAALAADIWLSGIALRHVTMGV